jgi:replicative DNA helicase
VPITLLPNLTDDGLAPGELAVIMAPTGAGKSMLAVAIAAYVYSCGGKVVYYTLELDKEVIGRRIDACLYNLNLWHVPDFHDIIEEEVKEFEEKGGRLVIQQYHRGKATVGTLAAHLKLLDFTPTLVVVDYGDELKPMIRRKDKIEELTDIYGDLKTFAQEAGVPLVSPSQVNRTAYGNEVFGLESTGGSMGKVNVADLVIIIGRPPSLKTEGKAVFTIAKDRNGTEKSIWATFNTKNVQIKTEGVEYIAKEKKEFKPYNNGGNNGNYKKKTESSNNNDINPLDFDEDNVNSWNNK